MKPSFKVFKDFFANKTNFKDLFSANKAKKIVLMDSEKVTLNQGEVYDIILSPRYYWAKKEALPVKYTYQAKSYAKSLFEGVVSEGEYKYLVKKQDEVFWIFAYDEKFIVQELERLGVDIAQVRKVYFSQVEFETLEKPIKINQKEALVKHNEAIIKVPLQMVQEVMSFDMYLTNHKLSNVHISLNKFGHIIDFKKMLVATFALLALIVLYFAHFIWLGSEQDKLLLQKEAIAKKYKMPTTTLQADALIRKYDKKAKEQIALRQKYYLISKLPLKPKEYVSNMEYKKKHFVLSIVLLDPKRVTSVQQYLKKDFVIDGTKTEGDTTTLKVHYD